MYYVKGCDLWQRSIGALGVFEKLRGQGLKITIVEFDKIFGWHRFVNYLSLSFSGPRKKICI